MIEQGVYKIRNSNTMVQLIEKHKGRSERYGDVWKSVIIFKGAVDAWSSPVGEQTYFYESTLEEICVD